jgi:hypothetical protein
MTATYRTYATGDRVVIVTGYDLGRHGTVTAVHTRYEVEYTITLDIMGAGFTRIMPEDFLAPEAVVLAAAGAYTKG